MIILPVALHDNRFLTMGSLLFTTKPMSMFGKLDASNGGGKAPVTIVSYTAPTKEITRTTSSLN